MAAKPILYSYFRSSCSWRVRIALAYKGVEYEYRPVHLLKDGGQQHTEDYRRVNPMAQVPALLHAGHTFTQSMSILEYVEESFPNKPLLPADPVTRAKVREVCEVIGSGIQPLQNLQVLKKVGGDKMEWARDWINKGFKALETLLSSCAGKYSVGDEITLADCYLVPQVANADRFKVDMTPFPTIYRINATVESHPAFIAAHLKNQPDYST